MSVVGKILVFMNLVFSLVVGGFAVFDYTTRTHYADAYKKLSAAYDTQRQYNTDLAAERDQLKSEKSKLYGDLTDAGIKGVDAKNKEDAIRVVQRTLAALKDRETRIDELTKKTGDLAKERDAANAKVAAMRAAETAGAVAAGVRQEDSTKQREALDKAQKEMFDMRREMNDIKDQNIQAQIKARTLEDYNKRLLSRVVELEKRGVGTAVAGRNSTAPTVDVEGKVMKADSNLVEISLGSDNGLREKQTLQVFRLGEGATQAKYKGVIRIVSLGPTSAVGQVEGKLSAPIQAGDRVANKIIAGGN